MSLVNVRRQKGSFCYDIGWVDPGTHRYYLADRTNKGIDVIDTTSNTYLSTLAIGKFEGFTGSPDTSGPDGILVVPAYCPLSAGDAHSPAKVVDVSSGAIV